MQGQTHTITIKSLTRQEDTQYFIYYFISLHNNFSDVHKLSGPTLKSECFNFKEVKCTEIVNLSTNEFVELKMHLNS